LKLARDNSFKHDNLTIHHISSLSRKETNALNMIVMAAYVMRRMGHETNHSKHQFPTK
jgi:flagellar biogenesis protein FliO